MCRTGSRRRGRVGDKMGRIKPIALGAVWAILGATLQCSAQNHSWMICGRPPPILLRVPETAEHMSRGQSTAIEFALNVFGVVVAYWLKFGLSYIDGGRSALRWHFPVAFRIIPLLFLVAIVWVFFESPRWLAKFGRDSESRYILGRLRGETGADADKAEDDHYHTFFGIGFGSLHTGRRVQLVIWLQIVREAKWISGLNNIFYMSSTLICVFTLDRIGRRWTLYWGSVGQGITMFLAGGMAAAAFVFLFTFVFGATWLTSSPLEVRVKDNARDVTLYVFGACNVLAVPVVRALYPESEPARWTCCSPPTRPGSGDFARLKARNPHRVSVASRGAGVVGPETGGMKAVGGRRRSTLDTEVADDEKSSLS
ncbi:hypothetical protein BJ546DRAFT_1033125 [Cryomyces antarcticus]